MILRFLVFMLVSSLFYSHAQFSNLPRTQREDIIEAIVSIAPYDNELGLLALPHGSGTIISSDGYILSNYHVVEDLENESYYHHLAIYTNNREAPHQLPKHTHWAHYVGGSKSFDIAILKIYESLNGDPIESFPSVSIGDSDQLILGDSLTFIGYPGASGPTVTMTSGIMSGWLSENFEGGNKRWIKTDGQISGGNSGGAALNAQGELIGIPTARDYDEVAQVAQAYLRPIKLAWPYIGKFVDSPTASPQPLAKIKESANDIAFTNADIDDRKSLAKAIGDKSFGELSPGNSISHYIRKAFSYTTTHSYIIPIDEDTQALSVYVDSHGKDLDLAVRWDKEISEFSSADYRDFSDWQNPIFVSYKPQGSQLHVDIVNPLDEDAYYTLNVIPEVLHTAENSKKGQASGNYGVLAFNQKVENRLGFPGFSDDFTYHSYVVFVPKGLSELSIHADGLDQEIQLAVHSAGLENTAYENADYFSKEAKSKLRYSIESPPEGPLFIEVINEAKSSISYTLEVKGDLSGKSVQDP